MTIRDLFTVRLLARCAPACALAVAVGCAQQQAGESASVQAESAVVSVPQPVVNIGAGAPKAQPEPTPPPKPEPETPAPTFAFTPDLTGKALPRVVAPDVSRPLPADKTASGPKPRAVPDRVLDPDSTVRANYPPPPLRTPKPAARKPADPVEKVPVNFGAGADDVPAKPVLPVTPVVTERSRDVNVPPPAPVLGRPASDRVGFDDPTSDLANAAVVSQVVKTVLEVSGFLKVTVPDPFELAEQVKPKVPQSAEPSAAPITINPQRVK
jgi:hypothetical protein